MFRRVLPPARSFLLSSWRSAATSEKGLNPIGGGENEEQQKIIEDFKARNSLQRIGKELNLLSVSEGLQKQTKSLMKANKKDGEVKQYLREQINSPFVQFNLLTRSLLREFLCHNIYTVIGRVNLSQEADNQEKISYNLQRFNFGNNEELGLMLFAFSDEDSLDSFQNQVKGKVMETAEIIPETFVSIISKLETETNPKYFADGANQLTAGIVVDPSLPTYFALSREKFTALPGLLIQLSIEAMFRKIQHEMINPLWPSQPSDTSLTIFFPQLLEFEEYKLFLLEDTEGNQSLLTITHAHPDLNHKGKYDKTREDRIYLPVFTDTDLACDYSSIIEYQHPEMIKEKTLTIVTMKGMEFVSWMKEAPEVHGFLVNPKESILIGETPRVPEDIDPSLEVTRPTPKQSGKGLEMLPSPYYSLTDWPMLPYLCSIKRTLLFK